MIENEEDLKKLLRQVSLYPYELVGGPHKVDIEECCKSFLNNNNAKLDFDFNKDDSWKEAFGKIDQVFYVKEKEWHYAFHYNTVAILDLPWANAKLQSDLRQLQKISRYYDKMNESNQQRFKKCLHLTVDCPDLWTMSPVMKEVTNIVLCCKGSIYAMYTKLPEFDEMLKESFLVDDETLFGL